MAKNKDKYDLANLILYPSVTLSPMGYKMHYVYSLKAQLGNKLLFEKICDNYQQLMTDFMNWLESEEE